MCRLVVLDCSKKPICPRGKIVPRGVIVTISHRVISVRDELGVVSRRGWYEDGFGSRSGETRVTASLKIFSGSFDSGRTLRVGSRLDKYRLIRRLGEGGFATVYSAQDTIEDRRVALKIPSSRYVSNTQTLDDMQREVRIMARLQHPGVLPLKDARFIDGHFVMAFPLGEETLADRLGRRIARATAVSLVVQMVEAVAYAHENKVLHRDIKPENFILFPGHEIRLTDFGLARIERGSHDESASGTLGYMAPEQAMGHPTYRSDVFSLGLVMYRILAGELPKYPFTPPLSGFNKLRRGVSADLVSLIRKAIDPIPNRRFRDAVAMNNSLKKIRSMMSERTSGRIIASKSNRRSNYRAA